MQGPLLETAFHKHIYTHTYAGSVACHLTAFHKHIYTHTYAGAFA